MIIKKRKSKIVIQKILKVHREELCDGCGVPNCCRDYALTCKEITFIV